QRVVVDRHGVRADPAHQAGEHVGAERDPAGADPSVRGAHAHAGAGLPQVEGGRVLVHADPEGQAGALQAPGQPGRVQHRHAPPVPEPGVEGGRVDLFPYRVGVQELDAVGEARPVDLLVPGAQFAGLVGRGGDVELAGAFEVAVDGVPGDRLLDGVEVAGAQFLQAVDLVRPAGQAVGQAVGEGGGAEPAVAAGGG